PPFPPDTWENRIIYDATYFRSSCLQPFSEQEKIRQHIPNFPPSNFSEDCLYLNIFAPNRTDRYMPKLPVLVFVHGGDFIGGSSQLYNGFVLAQRDAVVVTFNYRLGPLGFLTTNTMNGRGNYGLFDQRFALKFVYDNIREFNGDPENITVIGHEAGAASVGLHLLSQDQPLYFRRAVLMSGSDLCKTSYLRDEHFPLEMARALARRVSCYDRNANAMIECLRQRDPHSLINAQVPFPYEYGGHPWRPTIDYNTDDVLKPIFQSKPIELRRLGLFANVSVMIGTTSDESAEYIAQQMNSYTIENGLSKHDFDQYINSYTNKLVQDYYSFERQKFTYEYVESEYILPMGENYLDEETIANSLRYRYTFWPQPDNRTMIRQRLIDLHSDFRTTSCVADAARFHAIKTWNSSYEYVFSYHSLTSFYPQWMGAPAGYELYYLFGVPFFNDSIFMPWYGYQKRQLYTFVDEEMSNYTMHLFVNFARYGDPTPGGFLREYTPVSLQNPSNPYQFGYARRLQVGWSPMLVNNMTYLDIDYRPMVKTNYRFDEAGFWSDYWPMLWKKRITPIPTPYFKGAIMNHKDTTIVMWILVAGLCLFSIVLISLCCILFTRIRKEGKTAEFDRIDNN
ncbi:unnamed protein product, partial [Didymodactylos carnosus]